MNFLKQNLGLLVLGLGIVISTLLLLKRIETNDEEMRQFIYKLFKGEEE